MNIMGCVFRRSDKDPWENGVLINEGAIIIDTDGKPVPEPIWVYEQCAFGLCVNYDLDYTEQRNERLKKVR